ncbi:hypothetical protein BCR22_00755 [Enterococcus plantarum]|uniref:hypothetical protein n=1 Tax=Enterococcus plantarum TaxID=1077675 RepID=UPI00084DE34C|nr:hypothetical protein [Enterococcus plantarum]MBO0423609.1 hypothetical protein [Enterococcus plantarum]OEG20972.1 hypothetical protein BCR22_00755 [Enterococcus plantarum]
MFISFGMFIGLIIITIIMIALIIYLTFTGGNHKSHHDNTQKAVEAAKERLAQNNLTASQLAIDSTQNESAYPNDFTQETENHYYQESTYEETIEDDYSLHVLPYPKDDNFK